jgi:hypothetical protein
MDRTERFRGRLLAGDRALHEHIEGFLKTRQRSGGAVGEWTGYFDVPEGLLEPVVDGNRYRIVLIDGRSGTVNVHVSPAEDGGNVRAQFHGTGTFRK